jgi:rSAM/selenodomain-associated transferase 1
VTATLVAIAKVPVPGRAKTRLCPPCTPQQAAWLAEASLRDVLSAMLATPADRRVVVLDGRSPRWLPPQLEVVAQRGDGLDERLAHAFADVGPALVVATDTPQVRPADLAAGLRALADHDAVLGPAADGGYWAIGLRRVDPRAVLGIPMSAGHTLAAQRERLSALGLRCAELRVLRDVDTWSDALAVAADASGSRFAAALAAVVASEREAAQSRDAAVREASVEPPHPSGGHEHEHEQRQPLVRLLEHPAGAREIDELQEELLAECEQGGAARCQPDDERGSSAQLEQRDEPLQDVPAGQDDVVDERLEAGDVRAVAAAAVGLEVEDAARLRAVDERGAVGPDLDAAEVEQLGEPVREQDQAEEDPDRGEPPAGEDGVERRPPSGDGAHRRAV